MTELFAEHWFFIFFLFCSIGWVHETTVESLYHRRFVNRGMLKGPYIPIYGAGGIAVLFICSPFRHNGFLVYLSGLVCCTILEYFTGWLLEKIFKRQFWDYSMMKLTYKNRISLVSSLFWGVLALLLVYILFPLITTLIGAMNPIAILAIDTVYMTAMSLDLIFTVKKTLDFKEIAGKLSHEQIMAVFNEKKLKIGNTVNERKAAFVKYFCGITENDIAQAEKKKKKDDETDDSD